jgi:putative peptide zinc metalloprotease protein
MPSTPPELAYQPRLRSNIVFGPVQSYGNRKACFFKDLSTGRFHRIGIRERFLLNLMDGSRSLSEIGEAYERRFGRRLGPQSWKQLFEIIDRRSLLDDSRPPSTELDVEKPKDLVGFDGPLTKRFRLVNPNRLLDFLLPWVSFIFTRWFLYGGLAVSAVTEIWYFSSLKPVVTGGLRDAPHAPWYLWPTLGFLILFGAASHELAHGLTLRHFGMAVDEIGMIFRYITFFPYTKIDDVVLLHRRRDQVAVAFSGTFASLLFVVPFAPLWRLTPPGNGWHELAAGVLTSFNFTALFNLLPFVQLDGYHMLAFLTRRPMLRTDARNFLIESCLDILQRRPMAERGYSFHDRILLGAYGFGALGVTTLFMSWAARRYYHGMVGWAGSWGAAGMVVVIIGAMWFGPAFYRSFRSQSPSVKPASVLEPGKETAAG